MSEHQITPFVADGPLAMSSLDIAETTGKRHDHVMRDIRNMLTELHGENDVPRFGGVYAGANGEDRPCFNLPEREFMILVTGYSVTRRAKVIDRWKQLEAAAQQQIVASLPRDYPSALRALADSFDRQRASEERALVSEAKAVELEHQGEEIAPKAAIYDKYLNADGLMSLQDLGRALGQGPNKFIERLKGKWLFESRGTLIPHSRFADEGIKIFTVKSRMYGEKLRRQTMATPKAIPYFAKKLGAQPSGTAH